MIRFIIGLLAVAGVVFTVMPIAPSLPLDRGPARWLGAVDGALDEARDVPALPMPWTAPDAAAPAGRFATRARTVPDLGPCEPARVELSGFWKPTSTFEYFPADPPQGHPRRRDATVAGLHETAERMDVRIGLALRCLDERCQVCVSSVEGRIGYEPSRLGLRADLADNDCLRAHVLAHEQRHAAVTRKAEAHALRRARELLAWVRRAHPGHFVARSETDDGQRQMHSRVKLKDFPV